MTMAQRARCGMHGYLAMSIQCHWCSLRDLEFQAQRPCKIAAEAVSRKGHSRIYGRNSLREGV